MANWFIALPVAGTGWFDRIPTAPPHVRCFAESDLHMTVAFLGNVDETRARATFELAQEWPLGSVEATLGCVQPMGDPRRASALSILLEPPAPAIESAIASVRDGMLERAGVRPDRRPPLPHITLARIGRKAKPPQRRRAIAWAKSIDLGHPRIRVTQIALYTWSRDRKTSLFRIVDTHEHLPGPEDTAEQGS